MLWKKSFMATKVIQKWENWIHPTRIHPPPTLWQECFSIQSPAHDVSLCQYIKNWVRITSKIGLILNQLWSIEKSFYHIIDKILLFYGVFHVFTLWPLNRFPCFKLAVKLPHTCEIHRYNWHRRENGNYLLKSKINA